MLSKQREKDSKMLHIGRKQQERKVKEVEEENTRLKAIINEKDREIK